MEELTYTDAINIYGDFMKYDKAFIMLKNNECKLYKVDDKNYIYVSDNIKYDMKEVKYNSSLVITEELLEQIKLMLHEYIIKVDNTFDKYEVIDEELNLEDGYNYEKDDISEQVVIHKTILHVK